MNAVRDGYAIPLDVLSFPEEARGVGSDSALFGAQRRGAPSNLPVPPSTFVGRANEIRAAIRLLDDARVLTLVGPGGCGKTRLAIEIAGRVLDSYPGGVWFVDLAPVVDAAQIEAAVASALGLTRNDADFLPDAIGTTSALLIVDNCEHVRDRCAYVVESLLTSCASLTVLATSREPLRLPAETTWRLPAMSIPSDPHAARGEGLRGHDSIELFLDRALKAYPELVVEDDTMRVIAEICRTLDGLPLAIELAAARVRLLSVDEIRDGLAEMFRLLRGGTAEAQRHRSLDACMAWSYEQLSPSEKACLRRLAVANRPFTLRAAEYISGFDGVETIEVLDLLGSLVDRSLVLVDKASKQTRFRLLETIRQYAAERLREAREVDVTIGRHVDFYLDLASELGDRGDSGADDASVEVLRHDVESIADALDRSLASQPERVLQAVTAIWAYLFMSGRSGAGVHWIRAALERDDDSSPLLRARARGVLGILGVDCGDPGSLRALQDSASLFEDIPGTDGDHVFAAVLCFGALSRAAIALASADEDSRPVILSDARRALADARCIADASDRRGLVSALVRHFESGIAFAGDDFEGSIAHSTDALGIARETGLSILMSVVLYGRASTWFAKRCAEEARADLEEAIRVSGTSAPRRHLVEVHGALAWARLALGDVAGARASCDAVMRLLTEKLGAAIPALVSKLRVVAWVDEAESRRDDAIARLEHVVSRTDGRSRSFSLLDVAQLYLRDGDVISARQRFRAALDAARAPAPRTVRLIALHRPPIASSLRGLAECDVAEGRLRRAARLLGASEVEPTTHQEELGTLVPGGEDHLRAITDEPSWAAELELGRGLGASAIAYALEECHTDGRADALLAADRAVTEADMETAIQLLSRFELDPPLADCLARRARLAWAQDRRERAEDDAHRALAIAARAGDVLLAADVLEVLAAAFLWRRSPRDSARLIGAAEALGRRSVDSELSASVRESLGAAYEDRRAEGAGMSLSRVAALASKRRGLRLRPASGWTSLSPVEIQIAELVAQGLTNREVGEKLFISARTVQGHLARIFPKLGVSSRTELAAQAARSGLS